MEARNSSMMDRIAVASGLVILALSGFRTVANTDFWLHLAAGQSLVMNGIPRFDTLSFTRPDETWVADTWLYDFLVQALWRAGGAPLTTLVHLAVMIAAFALLVPVSRPWSGPLGTAFGLLLGAWLLAPCFTLNPYQFCFIYAAVFIRVLAAAREGWQPWALLLPAQILWTNMHASFLLGPLLCGVFASTLR